MASPLGWLRALLALFQQRSQAPDHSWVEPGNAITRAVLTGEALLFAPAAATALEAALPASAEPAFEAPVTEPAAEVSAAPVTETAPAHSTESPAEAKPEHPRKAGRAA